MVRVYWQEQEAADCGHSADAALWSVWSVEEEQRMALKAVLY